MPARRSHRPLGTVSRATALCGAALLAGWASLASAQTFPNAPVRLVSDSAPGSANDVTARQVAEKLGAIWKQQVITVNMPGASGGIAAHAVSAAAPDGYTIFYSVSSLYVTLAGAPGVPANLPIQLPRDFKPIGLVLQQPLFIGAYPKAPFNTVPELIAAAKAKPGSISYATTGRGRLSHLAMELFDASANVSLEMITYSGGAAQSTTDVAEGRVDLSVEAYAGLAGAFRGNLLKPIATTAAKRTDAFPDLPAVSETLPGYAVSAWGILVAPPGTPDTIVGKISADLRTALADPDLIRQFAVNAAIVQPMTPDETTKFVHDEQERWQPILKKAFAETK